MKTEKPFHIQIGDLEITALPSAGARYFLGRDLEVKINGEPIKNHFGEGANFGLDIKIRTLEPTEITFFNLPYRVPVDEN